MCSCSGVKGCPGIILVAFLWQVRLTGLAHRVELRTLSFHLGSLHHTTAAINLTQGPIPMDTAEPRDAPRGAWDPGVIMSPEEHRFAALAAAEAANTSNHAPQSAAASAAGGEAAVPSAAPTDGDGWQQDTVAAAAPAEAAEKLPVSGVQPGSGASLDTFRDAPPALTARQAPAATGKLPAGKSRPPLPSSFLLPGRKLEGAEAVAAAAPPVTVVGMVTMGGGGGGGLDAALGAGQLPAGAARLTSAIRRCPPSQIPTPQRPQPQRLSPCLPAPRSQRPVPGPAPRRTLPRTLTAEPQRRSRR